MLNSPNHNSIPLRIAFVCHEYPPGKHGGIGTFTHNLARELVACGHQVRVIGSYPENRAADIYEEQEGVRIWRLRAPRRKFGWIAARYRVFRMLADWSQQGELDLIEMADWQGWAMGWPRLPVPIIVRLNGSATYFAAEMSQRPSWTTRWIEGTSLRRADFWCSVSQYTAARTQSVLAPRNDVRAILYNSVELRQPRPLTERSDADVVFTGTLTKKKGVLSLIAAWPAVVHHCPQAHLHIYGKDGVNSGTDSMQAHLTSQLPEAIRATVTFHGHQNRETIHSALEHARAAVFPSFAEAFSLAPLEAMACACPTIYSQRGSGPELIEHGTHGLLIDPDRPDQISSAILRLIQDTSLADAVATQGWQRVRDRFTTKQIVSENEQFYYRCIDEYRNGCGGINSRFPTNESTCQSIS